VVDNWTPPGEFEEYRLVRLLGQGGMGSVWLAEDRVLGRLVAIKWIARAEPSARARERFAREARAAARLQHVNVVSVYRYGETGGRPYLVSEYIRGESLDKLAKPVRWERVLELGRSLARGLAAAHRHGIVHRDIKPSNAILSEDGEVKLVDFGLAYIETEDSSAATPSPRASGTPAYMAPEVRHGQAATRRSDVYQVGGILFELLTGKGPAIDTGKGAAPTISISDDTRETQDPASGESPAAPLLRDLLSSEGASFAAVVDRCLRIEPRDRFASGEELCAALEQLVANKPAPTTFDGNPYRGLLPFEAEHRAVFFGRVAEARTVSERLRGDAFVLVAGDSGVGKSSLCRAAVLPWIADGGLGGSEPWTIVRLVPGARPMSALVVAMSTAFGIDEALLDGLRDQPAAFVREVRRAARGGVVVFVDQLEELVSIADRVEAEAAAALLAELAVGIPGVRLLATVRSDFLSRIAQLPSLGAEVARSLVLLGPLSVVGARDAIVGPARATGVRFESDALVDELVAFVADSVRARSGAALPLLAFTLAELWDARDRSTGVISAESLAAIGGVRGALAKHADGVLAALLPEQRRAASRILVRLVAPGSTRVRRTVGDLGREGSAFEAALSALVRGRLVVARGSGEEATYELAHEGLIDGWPALAALISETAHLRVLQSRLAAAVADWHRMDRATDGLWSARQLADVAALPEVELTSDEAAFVRASRRAITRRRWLRGGAMALVPVAALSVYVGAELISRRDRDARIAAKLVEADGRLSGARAIAADHAQLRDKALALFDAGDIGRAETEWKAVLQRAEEAGAAYVEAARSLEAAFLLDTGRASVRSRLAELTFERLEMAERNHRDAERDELAARLELYDPAGTLMSRRSAPGEFELAVGPSGAIVSIVSGPMKTSDALASTTHLAPGTYLLEARAPGRATVRWPVRIESGRRTRSVFTLPHAEQVPPGMIVIPGGRFAYGSGDHEALRTFFTTAPMHDVEIAGYLIGAHEVTYSEWIEFLDQLSDEERARRTPHLEGSATVQVDAQLGLTRGPDGVYELRFSPASVPYRARAGDPIVYRDRTTRVSQDWRRFPVSGISSEDMIAYAAWLARSGKVPGARLCDEREWEHAARGVDGRAFPHGDVLAPDDANIDVTYGKLEGGYGLDVVGAHPATHSVYGLADTVGNVWEVTRSAVAADAIVMRGGCYYQFERAAHLANRAEVPASFRHLHVGFRICADAPAP
jgi:formylglycine-generating enzyme required for sulfatase activity/predicted Ser/Thr protein kinase